jgi:hypothetical protein
MDSVDPHLMRPNIKKLVKTARENISHQRELVRWAEDHLQEARRQLMEAEEYLSQLTSSKPPSVILRRSKDTWRNMPLTIVEAFNGYDNDHLILEPSQVKELRKILAEWDEDFDSVDVDGLK